MNSLHARVKCVPFAQKHAPMMPNRIAQVLHSTAISYISLKFSSPTKCRVRTRCQPDNADNVRKTTKFLIFSLIYRWIDRMQQARVNIPSNLVASSFRKSAPENCATALTLAEKTRNFSCRTAAQCLFLRFTDFLRRSDRLWDGMGHFRSPRRPHVVIAIVVVAFSLHYCALVARKSCCVQRERRVFIDKNASLRIR